MATDGVVVTQANEATPNIGDLFAGKCFLVAQRVPMRSNFVDRIRANGGRVVRLETQADYIIADHARKDCPPTSLSYTFIEAAIAAGALPDPNDHRAGPAPGFARVVGSTVIPPKATRTAFTPQDDRDLWMWVQNYQGLGRHSVKGNEIYKQLEAHNSRHTFQSWRDRYVKKLMANPPQGVPPPQNLGLPPMQPASSQVRQPAVDGTVEEEAPEEEDAEVEHSVDVKFLLDNMDDILNIPAEDLDTVWASLADEEVSSHLSADQWKRLYEEEALPVYEAKQKKAKRAQASPLKRKARVATPEPPEQNAQPTTPELVAMRAKAARDRQVSPSVSQKRRRQTATPQSNTYGRKRVRTDHSEIFGDEQPAENGTEVSRAKLAESPANPQNVNELGLDSENANGDNPDEPALPGEEPLPTSELNRAAKAQLIAEANSKNIESELPSQPEVQDDTQETITADAQEEIVPQNGLQLTEENLANQQAEHGVKLTRASDLRPNDGNINNYAAYLQKLVAGHIAARTGQPQAEASQNVAEPDLELESDRELSPVPEAQTTSKTPQNGEDVASANVNGNSLEEMKESNGDFDSIFVPQVAGDSAEAGLGESDLPGEDSAPVSQIAVEADPFDDLPPFNDHLENNVRSFIDDQVLDGPVQRGSDEEMTDNVEIDLTLAEPEGGFQFSSQEEVQPDALPNQHQWEPAQPQTQANGTFSIASNTALAAPDLPNMSEDEEMEAAPAKAITPKNNAALDTQDIYATAAQQPDFSFPLPPDSDVEDSELELPTDPVRKPAPAQKTTPKPTISPRKRAASATPRKLVQVKTHREPAAPEPESVESFIARLTADGCTPASVHSAVYRTSAQLDAAEVVARYERIGHSAPDIPEVWSEEDDAKVGTTDAKVFKALCEKKGWEEYDLRLKFLQHWKSIQ